MNLDDDFDSDGNNIVPCPICLSSHCPSKEDGKCPEEDEYIKSFDLSTHQTVEELKKEATRTASLPSNLMDVEEGIVPAMHLRTILVYIEKAHTLGRQSALSQLHTDIALALPDIVEKHFPKGETNERGKATILGCDIIKIVQNTLSALRETK